ncbi:MAG TPA: DUF1080 domain-containing protein [Gemmatimonas sp.]
MSFAMLSSFRLVPRLSLRAVAMGALLSAASMLNAQVLEGQAGAPIIGRWDLTVQGANGPYPSWLEVSQSGIRTLVGRFVGSGGSARPIAKVEFANNTMRFAIPPQWDAEPNDLRIEATFADDRLSGTLTTPRGESHRFVAVRAPLLRRTAAPVWGTPVTLFDGKSMDAWAPLAGTSRWSIMDGVLTNSRSGANLATKQHYTDFKLHLEFRYPKGGNSGVYLRGRYEVQVEDNGDLEPTPVHLGGIYGFLTANENVSKGPGVWQTYDITLIGRRVTVVLNGKTVIADQTIPGITGGALDSNEGQPGPIYLQGDHTAVEYRNIIITPARAP